MQHAALVREVDRPCHGRHQMRGAIRIANQVGDCRGQAAALDQLHGEVVLALVFADLVDGQDVRMVEIGRRLGFPVKARHVRLRRQLARQDHLERHQSIEADLAGLEDDAMPPRAISASTS
jgi:hypothetical protein